MLSRFTNQDYLQNAQYRNSSNLAARIRLHELYSTDAVHLHLWLFDHLLQHAPANAHILEVGAGRGDVWVKNVDRIPQGWHITLTDFSEGMLADCQSRLGEHAGRFTFQQMDIQAIPYPDKAFDVVMGHYMLYHVPDLPKGLSEVRRVLKPSGVFMAATNGNHHMQELYQWIGEIETNFDADLMTLFGRTFSLQNGGAQLRQVFGDVTQYDFPTGLRITELPPIVDYFNSMIGDELPTDWQATEVGQRVISQLEGQIQREGAVHVTKETGLFIAQGYAE